MSHRLEADSIIKSFGGRELLTDCWVSCDTGEILGMLGRNGCGKSTLMKIIFGTEPALNKSIRIDGKYYETPFTAGNLIGYLPQKSFLPNNLTLRKIADLYLPDIKAKEALLAHRLIQQHMHLRRHQLSGGTGRFFEILLLVHLDVHFVLLDEPFNGLEPLLKEEVLHLLQEKKKEKGFIITDHDFRNIIQVSDRIMLIDNGVCRHIKQIQELERFGYVPSGIF
ncbi:ATP-binding cassette domain-containing protein [Chitinophaga jiangningensis]|nr:ATP-binding cassette domain-containing protein [Chitinophaga jiangningensis]